MSKVVIWSNDKSIIDICKIELCNVNIAYIEINSAFKIFAFFDTVSQLFEVSQKVSYLTSDVENGDWCTATIECKLDSDNSLEYWLNLCYAQSK